MRTFGHSRTGLLFAVPAAGFLALVGAALCMALLFGSASACQGGAPGAVQGVPARLGPIYLQASGRYGLGQRGPAILAAINKVETDFGANQGPSSAGAIGWMQFEPETWAAYGVDADGDGRLDPSDPWDAIFAAARYLRASGAPGDWSGAILSYNHAASYVEEVLGDARRFASPSAEGEEEGSCAAPAPNEAVGRMVAEADRLSALRPQSEYVSGGSHGSSPTPPDGPFDCSSAVSHLLQIAGYGNPTMDTTVLVHWGEPGPGRWVTIFVKPYGVEAHTFIRFDPTVTPPGERYWGTSGIAAPGKGPGWIAEGDFSAEYLAGFQMRHPPGL
jgi:transglycosylase-like protein with SLT domain